MSPLRDLALTLTILVLTAAAATAQDGWTELAPDHVPSARGGHSLTTVDGVAYLFGGFGNEGRLNDLWRWDADAGDWVELDPANPPTPRFGHSSLAADGKLWVVFGQDGTMTGSIWVYDPASNAWTDVTGQLGRSFGVRHQMGATVVTVSGEQWIVFNGGMSFFFEALVETWALRVSDLGLFRLADLPAGRWGHALLPVLSMARQGGNAGVYTGGGRSQASDWQRRLFLPLPPGEDWGESEHLLQPSDEEWPALGAVTVGPDGSAYLVGGETTSGPTDVVRRVRITHREGGLEVSESALPRVIGMWREMGVAIVEGISEAVLLVFGGFSTSGGVFDDETLRLALSQMPPAVRETLSLPAANGQGGTPGNLIEWTTGLFGYFGGSEPCQVMASTVNGPGKQDGVEIPLEPGGTLWFDDVLSELFGVTGTYAIHLEGSTECLTHLHLVSRIASSDGTPNGPSQGQGFRPLGAHSQVCAGEPPVTVLGLRSGMGWRTNLGFIPVGGMPVDLRVSLFDADTSAFVGDLDVSLLDDLEQVNRIVEQVAAGVRAAVAEIEVVSEQGCARAYGSAISPNQDPTTLEAGRPLTTFVIPVVARATGASSSEWRSDVFMVNPRHTAQPRPITVELAPGPSLDKALAEPLTLVLQPGEVWWSEDVLGETFGIDGSGWLEVTADGPVLTASRTYSIPADDPTGPSYGQGIGPVPVGDLFGPRDEVVIPGLRRSADPSVGFRTNIGFENPGEVVMELRIQLFGTTGRAVPGEVTFTVQPGDLRIVTDIYRLVTGDDVDRGHAIVSTDTAGAQYFVFGSVVDNQTGDATYIDPR